MAVKEIRTCTLVVVGCGSIDTYIDGWWLVEVMIHRRVVAGGSSSAKDG